jgi:hypothetical protein
MNLVDCDKAPKTQVRGVRKPEARFGLVSKVS